ncbi:MAG TPA: sigma-70 family RNA polymerase sigma factor [Rhizomicrobium sp.]|nr:sigma-70 family RNA polymerase sigma factor [Rhizomicrobium sp.]
MGDTSDTGCETADLHLRDAGMSASGVNEWFVREILPLETALMQFLRRGWRNSNDVEDLCHDVFVHIYEAARREIPHPAKPFAFAVARNLLIDRIRRENIVAIEAVADMETLGITIDEPGPDRTAIARQELRRLQAALNRLPDKWRETVVMRKIDGLSRPQIAERLGVAEPTVSQYLAQGMTALADFFSNDPTDTGGTP